MIHLASAIQTESIVTDLKLNELLTGSAEQMRVSVTGLVERFDEVIRSKDQGIRSRAQVISSKEAVIGRHEARIAYLELQVKLREE